MVKTALILLCLLSNISLNAGEQVLIYKNTEQADLKLHLLYPDDIKKSDKRAAIIFFVSLLHLEFRHPLRYSSLAVSKAVPQLGCGISPLTYQAAYVRFTPSDSD